MALTNITFDAVDPGRLAAFWAAVTGRQVAEATPDVVLLTCPAPGSPRIRAQGLCCRACASHAL